MTKKRTIDPAMIDNVAQNMFHVLPLVKKRLLHMDLVQKEHGTPLSHVQVLAMLQDVGTMSVSEISRRLGIAKPNITPLLDSLSARGLVERIRGAGDKRIVNVHLTEAGQKLLSDMHQAIVKQVSVLENCCTRSEVKQMNHALAFLVQIANRSYKNPVRS